MVTAAMKLKDGCSLEEYSDQPRQHIKKHRHYLVNRAPSNQSYSFSSSDVWMPELGYNKSWAPMNGCFWTVVLEKTLESPLDCKEIEPFNRKGNQSWMFIGRTETEGGAPLLWPPDAMNWLIGEDPDAGKVWRWEEKGITDSMDGHDFEQAPGVGDRHGSLAYYSPWDCKESDTTEWLNWTGK